MKSEILTTLQGKVEVESRQELGLMLAPFPSPYSLSAYVNVDTEKEIINNISLI